MTEVVTRFAPSPTGYLHIGGARTALFNWLFARRHGGSFRLRIEDTDRARNIEAAVQPILDGLAWLGIDHDGEAVRQSMRADRHIEVAHALLASGAAYRCTMDADEVAAAKEENRRAGRGFRGRDRDAPATDGGGTHPIRLRAPDTGETVIDDLVQGSVTVANSTLDDMIILRSDGTPTYMLASVVDDHDMGVTHVIRGDDHLSNAFRQIGIVRAMGWSEPTYAHIALINDETGRKLSKRHGAVGIDFYREAGFLPEAVFNYLLRLGWGHGDKEILSRDRAVDLFGLDGAGKSPSRLDMKRLEHINGVYIREMTPAAFAEALRPFMAVTPMVGMVAPLVQERCRTMVEARNLIRMVIDGPSAPAAIDDNVLREFAARRRGVDQESVRRLVDEIAAERGIKVKHVVAPIRMAIMGAKVSPPLFEAMEIIGEQAVSARLAAALGDR